MDGSLQMSESSSEHWLVSVLSTPSPELASEMGLHTEVALVPTGRILAGKRTA